MLTDHESGIVFHIDARVIGCIFNRGAYREVKTKPESIFRKGEIYIVREQVKDIIIGMLKETERTKKNADQS